MPTNLQACCTWRFFRRNGSEFTFLGGETEHTHSSMYMFKHSTRSFAVSSFEAAKKRALEPSESIWRMKLRPLLEFFFFLKCLSLLMCVQVRKVVYYLLIRPVRKRKTNQFLYSGINSTGVTGNLVSLLGIFSSQAKKKYLRKVFRRFRSNIIQMFKKKNGDKKMKKIVAGCMTSRVPVPHPQIDSCSCTRWGPSVFTQPRELFWGNANEIIPLSLSVFLSSYPNYYLIHVKLLVP